MHTGELHEICAMSLPQRFHKKSSQSKYLTLIIDSTEFIDTGFPKNHYFTNFSNQEFILDKKVICLLTRFSRFL